MLLKIVNKTCGSFPLEVYHLVGRWLQSKPLNIKQIHMQLRSIMGETVNRETVGTVCRWEKSRNTLTYQDPLTHDSRGGRLKNRYNSKQARAHSRGCVKA